MNLLYHKFLDRQKYGILVFEFLPHQRTMQTHYGYYRLHLPYLYFIFQYKKFGNDYQYGGIYDEGLKVFCSAKPIVSFTEGNVGLCHLETKFKGNSCTPHYLDETHLPSLRQLVNLIINEWWGLTHDNVSYEWRKTDNPENLSKIFNGELGNLIKAIDYCSAIVEQTFSGRKSDNLPSISTYKVSSEKNFVRIPWEDAKDIK